VVAGEGFGFGEGDDGFGTLSEVVAHAMPGFFGGAGLEAVMTDSGKSFGKDVEEPAPDKFVRMKVEDGGLFGGGVGPEEFDVSLGIVSEEAFGVEGAAVDVSGEVAQRGFSAPDGFELDVPFDGWTEGALLVGGEVLIDVGMLDFEGALYEATEAGGEGREVEEEVAGLGRVNEAVLLRIVGDGGDDVVDVGVVLHLATPGVEDARDAEFEAGGFEFGGGDVVEGLSAALEEKAVEFLGAMKAE
jgi:hypothetical protein